MENRRYFLSVVLSLILNFIVFYSASMILKTSCIHFEEKKINLTITFENTEKKEENIESIHIKKDTKVRKKDDEILKALASFKVPKKTKKRGILTPRLMFKNTSSGYTYGMESKITWHSEGILKSEKKFHISSIKSSSGGKGFLLLNFKELSKFNIPNFKEIEASMERDYKLKLQSLSPERARLLQGEVIVVFDIEKSGIIGNLKVVSSSDPILTDIAVRNITKLKPAPRSKALRNIAVKIEFSLP